MMTELPYLLRVLLIFNPITLILLCIALGMLFNPVTGFWYLMWVFLVDKNSKDRGGRLCSALGKSWILQKLTHYFQSEVVFEDITKLKHSGGERKAFVFGLHPHGIFGLSIWANLISQSHNLREGLDLDYRVCTLNANFYVPICRDILMGLGFVSANKESIEYCLENGISIGVVLGGAAESLLANPGKADLVLNSRKGFVKVALLMGADIVPVYSFGENDLFTQVKDGQLRKLQRAIQRILTFTVPIFYGRFMLCPRRRKLTMVFGEPIPVPPCEGMTFEERVDVYHSSYVKALKDLFEKYVGIYGSKAERAGKGLRIVK